MPQVLLNTTLLAVGLSLLLFVVAKLKATTEGRRFAPDLRGTVRSFLSVPVLAVLVLGTSVQVAYALYLAYEAPRDILQDVASARELIAGRSPYPAEMSAKMREAVESDPARFSLGPWWPALQRQESYEAEHVANAHWVQAHPPTMTLLAVPLVEVFGVRKASVAVALVSLALLLGMLWLLRHELAEGISGRMTAILALLTLGWQPVLVTLRTGQSGILLAALVTLGWFALRKNRPVAAGAAVGLATCLKLYPGLLLVYFALRQRRAFLAALGTIAVVAGITGALAGWNSLPEYLHTAGFVIRRYEGSLANLSLVGLVLRLAAETGLGTMPDSVLLAIGIGVVFAIAALIWHRHGCANGRSPDLDLDYSLFVVLMPLLSPIAWHHYLPVLLLPLAVMARRILDGSLEKRGLFGLLVLLVLLSLPERTPQWIAGGLDRTVGHLAAVIFSPVFALSTAALCVWVASMHHESPSERPA